MASPPPSIGPHHHHISEDLAAETKHPPATLSAWLLGEKKSSSSFWEPVCYALEPKTMGLKAASSPPCSDSCLCRVTNSLVRSGTPSWEPVWKSWCHTAFGGVAVKAAFACWFIRSPGRTVNCASDLFNAFISGAWKWSDFDLFACY